MPWNFDHPDGSHALKRLERTYLRIIDAADHLLARQQLLEADANLSPVGRKSAAYKFALGKIVPEISSGRLEVQAARNDLKSLHENLKPPTVDKTDAVGAILRDRIRQKIEAMDATERAKMAVGGSIDPVVVQAIAEAPAYLSGLSDESRQKVIDGWLREHGQAAFYEIAELEKAIDQTERTLAAARNLMIKEVSDGDTNAIDEAIKAGASNSVIWLRRCGGEVRVVDLNARNERPATEDEQRAGQFFGSFEEYEAARHAL